MACENMGLLLSKLVDGELSPEERSRVEDHLAGCASCRADVEVFHKTERLVSDALAGEFFQASVVRAVMADLPPDSPIGSALPLPIRRLRAAGPLLAAAGRRIAVLAAAPATYAAALLLVLAWMVVDQSRRHDRLVEELLASVRAQREEVAKSSKAAAELSVDLTRLATALAHPPAAPAPAVEISPKAAAGPEELAAQPFGTTAPGGAAPLPAPKTPEEPAHEGESVAAVPTAPQEVITQGADLSVKAAPAEDGILVQWKPEPQVHAMAYNIYRRRGGQEEFKRITEQPLKSNDYLDTDVQPRTRYTYKVEAVTPDTPEKKVESPAVETESQGDFEISFLGWWMISRPGGTPDEVKIRVGRYQDGRWVDATFSIQPGQTIGASSYVATDRDGKTVGREIDFSTRYKLVTIDSVKRPYTQKVTSYRKADDGKPILGANGKAISETRDEIFYETVLRVLIEDEKHRLHPLWKGDRRRGTIGLLQE